MIVIAEIFDGENPVQCVFNENQNHYAKIMKSKSCFKMFFLNQNTITEDFTNPKPFSLTQSMQVLH